MTQPQPHSSWRTPAVVLGCGAAILALSLGIRHGFGLFLQPMSLATGWGLFLFHQIGAFFGGWFGGYVFDHDGSYTTVWQIAIALGLLAALLNFPVQETLLVRKVPAAAAG